MRSGLLTFIGLKVIHVDFYVIGFLSVVKAPWVNRRFTGSPRRGPWVGNFFKGLYMYIYTNVALQLDPLPPCSSVHYCSVVHYCTSVHYCQLPDPDCRSPVAGCVKGFFVSWRWDMFNRLLFALSFNRPLLCIWWKALTGKSILNIYLTAFDLAV